jgi:hypothetical protein
LAFPRRIPGLKSETPRHAGAGWGTLRVARNDRFGKPRGWDIYGTAEAVPLVKILLETKADLDASKET